MRPALGLRPPAAVAAARLLAVRTLAWALLFSGWLVLGGLGRLQAPAGAWTLAPVALWLLAAGVASGAGRVGSMSGRSLMVSLALAGLATVLALLATGRAGLAPFATWVAAIAWGVLLALASRAVRRMRLAVRGQGLQPPSPVPAAVAGALLAWAVAGDPIAAAASPVVAAGLPAVAALMLVLLVPGMGPGAMPTGPGLDGPACRSGLFDCALGAPPAARWRDRRHWPVLAASLAMLPMMASLALMAEACAVAGLAPASVTGLHLAAMLAPALVLHALARSVVPGPRTVAALMVAGGLVAFAVPGPGGLMTAMALQGAAWGLGWAVAMGRPALAPVPSCVSASRAWSAYPAAAAAASASGFASASASASAPSDGRPPTPPSPGTVVGAMTTDPAPVRPPARPDRAAPGTAASPWLAAATVLALGAWLGVEGPAAWAPLHAALGLVALAGVVGPRGLSSPLPTGSSR